MAAVNPLAEETGVAPGMALADARALCPGLDAVSAEPQADAATLHRLTRWCERYTPWTAADGMDGLFLDITGCAHLFGGERTMLEDMLRRFEGMGLTARGAVADTPGAAWALGRYGESGTVLATEAVREALAHLPIAALRLDAATVGELERLGLRRIGDLYPLPRSALAARFGRKVTQHLDQALGRLAEPISPLRPAAPYRVRLAFPEPIANAEDIAEALKRLLARLCRMLEENGRGARKFTLVGFRADHTMESLSIGTARSARDPDRLAGLFAERIERFDPGFGIETMALEARGIEPLAPAQARFQGRDGGAREDRPPLDRSLTGGRGERSMDARLAELIDRLGNRMGIRRVVRYVPVASHMPERACRAVPALHPKAGDGWPAAPQLPPRPLRLLRRSESLEVVALVPDGEPGDPPALFRWRRQTHTVRQALGPERILPEWWRGTGTGEDEPRDYWCVEDEAGKRFWLYHQGPLGAGATPRWFLHGLFS